MQALPHQYVVSARAKSDTYLELSGDNLPVIEAAAPTGFGGPGDVWSPEDLLMSSVAACTILSFKAIAQISKLAWESLECVSEGTLDRVERTTLFTKVVTRATLTISNEEDREKAEKLLNKAEQTCLVSNSLSAQCSIECTVLVA